MLQGTLVPQQKLKSTKEVLQRNYIYMELRQEALFNIRSKFRDLAVF